MLAEEDEENRGRMYDRIRGQMERSVVTVRPNCSVPRKPPRKAGFTAITNPTVEHRGA